MAMRTPLLSSLVALGAGALCLAFTLPLTGQEDGAAPPKQEDATPKKAPKLAKGRVVFDGELPMVKELEVPAESAEGCCPPGEEVDRSNWNLVISEDRGIQNCVVTVKVADAKVEVPEEAYELDQKGCRFLPHVLVVPQGAKVAFLNSDETSHNVRLTAVANEGLNQTVAAGKKLERTFEEPEAMRVACDMHPWMAAWVVVTDATHWALTDAEGHFALEDLPAGTHKATVWHETLGKKEFDIVVGDDGEAKAVEVELAKKKTKKRRRRR